MPNYPQFPDIPVAIRNRNAVVGGTSTIDYPTAQFGMPIDLVVPWDLPYIYDDRAKITVGAQTGTVSFGRQVGLRYRMAHIRGIQIGASAIETGTISVASAVDQQPPTYSAGDAAFQAWFIQNWPTIEFGDRTDRRGSWRPTGSPSSMTRIEISELEPGRTVLKGWGRVANQSVFKANEIRTMSANSLMFMWWCYFWPETALVKWEMAFWYCDAKNGAAHIYTLPEMSIGVQDRLHLDVKWRNQRLVDAASRDTYTLPGRRFHDFIDVAGPLQFGQGALFTGHFLDTSRLAHTEQDYECLTDYDLRASTYQYWINAIAARATWEGKTPVWGVVPKAPSSFADPLTLDVLTIGKYQQHMTLTDAESDPVFSHAGSLWTAVANSSGNPAGPQSDYGHGKCAMYWSFNPAGNPDAVEFGYFGQMPMWGVQGKYYHQGPDETPRTDTWAPGGPNNPGRNKTDGTLYAIEYPGGIESPDNFFVWPRTAGQDFRVPSQQTSHLLFDFQDDTVNMRGDEMFGTDGGHCGNSGLLICCVTTGSWAMYELMRQQTIMYMYHAKPWAAGNAGVLILEQQRFGRSIQTIVNGYWAEHVEAKRANIVAHLRRVAELPSTFDGKGNPLWTGFERWRNASAEFYQAPNRAVWMAATASKPNVDPPLAYNTTNTWQWGAMTGLYQMALLTDSASMKNFLWAAAYSFLRYGWANFAVHPDVEYLDDIGDTLERDRQAAKCPGWLLAAYVVTPGMTVGNTDGGDGFGPDTPNPDWLTRTNTAQSETRNARTWWSREGNAVTSITAAAMPVVTFTRNLPAWLTGEVQIRFHYTNSTPPIDGWRTCNVTGANEVTLESGQVTTTGSGDDGRAEYNTPWYGGTDEGQANQAFHNSYPDPRRVHFDAVDWGSPYGTSAVRVCRLITQFKPEEVTRNQAMLVRVDEVLGSWNPRFHAKDYETQYPDPNTRWYNAMIDTDWFWPTSYEPGPGNRQVTVRPQTFAQHPQSLITPLSIGVRPIVAKIQRRIPDKDFSGSPPIGGDDLTRSIETRLREADRQPGVITPAQGSVPADRRRGRLARRRDRLEEEPQ